MPTPAQLLAKKGTPQSVPASVPPSEEQLLQTDMLKRYDQLNSLWRTAEEQIKQFLVPTQVVHVYRSEQDDRDQQALLNDLYCRHSLAWAKAKGGWRLCYGYMDESWNQGDCDYSFTPILDTSVDIRKECVPAFAELKKKVIEKAKETLPQLDDAIANLSAALK